MVERTTDAEELEVIDAAQSYLRHDIPFDAALGLPTGWRQHVIRRSLLEALRQVIQAMPSVSHRAAARTLHQQLLRYAATAWRADRAVGRRPDGARGRLFDILAILGEPLSQERLRKLLAEAGASRADDLTHRAA